MLVTSNFGAKPLLSEKLAHQPQRRPGVGENLDQHVEDLAFVVDGTPEVHPLAGDPNNHLVQLPSIARAGTALPQLRAIRGPNFSTQRRTVS